LKINLVAVLTAMLRAGPSAAKVKDRDGNLPLHCVCESRKLTGKIQSFATDMLIDAYPGGLRVKDKQGNLPLHSAIERGNSLALNVLQKMVQIFPDACKATDKEKNTPLHSALECRTKDLAPLVKLLLSADSTCVAVKTKDRDGQLPVHCTINMSKNIEQHDILCMLVEASPSCAKEVNPRDKKVLLQWALDRNALQVVASIARAAAETFEIKCCRVSSSSYPMFPLHYVCAHLPTVTIGVMQVVAKASSNACVTKDRQGKIPLRILHEEGSRPELIACVKKAMGPAAYNAIICLQMACVPNKLLLLEGKKLKI
jgi:ankyrin repeat protein